LCSLRRRLDLAQTAINDLVDDLFEKLAQGGVPWPFKVLMFFFGGVVHDSYEP
jgi:hypothetical protein